MPLQLNIFYTDKDGVTHDGYIVSDDVYVGDQTLTDVLSEITGERGNIIAESGEIMTSSSEITLSSIPEVGMYYFIPVQNGAPWDVISWGSAGADEYGLLSDNAVVKKGQAAIIKYNGGAGAESGTGAFDLIAVFSSSLDGLFTYSVTGSSGRIDVDYGDISSLDVYLGDNTCLYVSDMSDVVNISLNGSGSNKTDLNYAVLTQLNDAKHTHSNKTVLDNVSQDNIDVLSHMELDGSMLTIGNVDGNPDGSVDVTMNCELNCTDIRTMYLYVSNASNDTYTIAYDDIVNWNKAYEDSHSHDNLDELDGITSSKIADWDDTVSSVNSLFDNLPGGGTPYYVSLGEISAAIGYTGNLNTDADNIVYAINELADESHTHSNLSTLNGISSTYVSNWNTAYSQRHTHSNQSVLNGISSTDVSNWDDAYSDSHSHANLTALDSITSTTIANWNNKVDTSNLPNIKKNSSSTSGDIISSHITIGSRGSGTYGTRTLAIGTTNVVSANSSAVIGTGNNSSAYYSLVAGQNNTPSGYGHGIFGLNSSTTGNYSLCSGTDNEIGGYSVGMGSHISSPSNQGYCFGFGFSLETSGNNTAIGHHNKAMTKSSSSGTSGDAFVIGNGTDSATSNAFRVTYSGAVYGKSTYHSTGADYAEYFEWEDGNPNTEDRRGLFVTWGDNGLVKLANNGDEILGVVSVTPSVAGNAYEDDWQGMYQTDIFGQPLSHIVHHDAEYVDIEMPDVDDDGNELETTHIEHQLLHEAYDAEEYILNPEYDSEQEYIPRSDRKEWTVVGLMGQLIVIDDGSCTVNGYCTVSKNGVGTASETGFRVLSRLDDTHIKIFVK